MFCSRFCFTITIHLPCLKFKINYYRYFCREFKLINLNYLAHIFLSGKNSKIQIGNFIGDFVKGSKFNDYPPKIREGILFHRRIDEFTDSHPIVIEFNKLLRPTFARYSGIISDMYFDHFLAKNFRKYSSVSLLFFAWKFYFYALLNYWHLPSRVKGFIFHFILSNRLNKYQSQEGLRNSLEIMSKHKVKALNPDKTIQFLQQHHDELEVLFDLFFKDLIAFCENQTVGNEN